MPPKQQKQDAPTVALQMRPLFSQQRSVALLAGSELDYDSMSLTQLRACCGQKHGNSITVDKKDNEGHWKKKLKEELILDFKNAAMLRSRIGGSKKGFAALFSKQSSAASSTDSVLASSTAMSLPGVAQPLVGSEVSVAAPQALLRREKNANPASSMISTGATPNSMRKPASFEPASDSGMALDGKRNLNWYWSLTASGASLVGWNGPLTEEQIDHWEFLAAQGITVSRATFAEDKLMSLICGPFAKRHFKSMKAKKTVAQTKLEKLLSSSVRRNVWEG